MALKNKVALKGKVVLHVNESRAVETDDDSQANIVTTAHVSISKSRKPATSRPMPCQSIVREAGKQITVRQQRNYHLAVGPIRS
jgi:hypothetical protein